MAEAKIVDESGEWFVNNGQFPFVDPMTGNRFEPNTMMKVLPTEWLAGQPVIGKVPADPMAKKPDPVEPVKAPAK